MGGDSDAEKRSDGDVSGGERESVEGSGDGEQRGGEICDESLLRAHGGDFVREGVSYASGADDASHSHCCCDE